MLTRDEHVYLIDFGIARLFKPGQASDTIALGSPGYAAPEQYGKAQTTASADIYSLGATLHHTISGHDPSANPFQFAPLRLPQEPGLPELEALILQMIETRVEQRPTSMQEIKKALQAISQQHADEAVRTQQSKQSGGSTSPAAFATSTTLSPPVQRPGQSLSPTEEIIVDKAGSGQYSSICEALKNASPHARILVRPGIYQESLVLDKPVEISGSGPVEQVVIESSSGNCLKMASDVATVRQLTLRGCAGQGTLYHAIAIPCGHLLMEHCHVTSNSGPCIGSYNAGASATIRHCQIHDSPSNGIYIHTAGQAVIEDCDLSGHEMIAILLGQTTKVLIQHCKIHDNNGNGIYISQEQKQVVIEECEIFRNGSSGVAIREKGHTVIRRCQICDGRSNGIYIFEKGRGTIEECEIYCNEYPNIFITGESEALLRRCKVYESKSNGIYLKEKSKSTIEGGEVYRHENTQIYVTGESDVSIYRCKIYEGESGGIGLYDKSKALIERCEIHHDKSTLIFSTGESN